MPKCVAKGDTVAGNPRGDLIQRLKICRRRSIGLFEEVTFAQVVESGHHSLPQAPRSRPTRHQSRGDETSGELSCHRQKFPSGAAHAAAAKDKERSCASCFRKLNVRTRGKGLRIACRAIDGQNLRRLLAPSGTQLAHAA